MKKYQVNFYLDDDLVISGPIEAKSKAVAEMNAEIELLQKQIQHDLNVLGIRWNRVEATEIYEGIGEFGDDEGW